MNLYVNAHASVAKELEEQRWMLKDVMVEDKIHDGYLTNRTFGRILTHIRKHYAYRVDEYGKITHIVEASIKPDIGREKEVS